MLKLCVALTDGKSGVEMSGVLRHEFIIRISLPVMIAMEWSQTS